MFVSNWQYQQFINVLGIPYSQKHIVIEHGVRTFDDDQLNNRPNPQEQLRLIYTSTPHRGLGILVPVFQKLAENNPNIHLDVFSSFAIYGWPETDQQFEQLLNICREHPQITYHGSAPNDVVREHLARAHVFAYPSIWPETSCRSLIEAMMAGLVCVHPNYAALPDTASGFTYMYSGDQNHEIHAQLFYDGLSMLADEAANGNFVNQKQLAMMRWYANYRFNMVQAKTKWATVMHMLLQNFPTVESRKIPEKTFTFKIG